MKTVLAMLVVMSVSVLAGYDFTITDGYFEAKTLTDSQTMLVTGGEGIN
jgi:hypothetical protein